MFWVATAYFFQQCVAMGKSLGLPEGHRFFRFVAEQRGNLALVTTLAVILIVCGMVIAGLAFSHRVAGSLERVTRHMRAALAAPNATIRCVRKICGASAVLNATECCVRTLTPGAGGNLLPLGGALGPG
ncbi:MAG: hypothetical protein IT285_14220 [Bdellovibrionales bacterium]|nr:hypothetical protein [Bdellovibrionales bacterium]